MSRSREQEPSSGPRSDSEAFDWDRAFEATDQEYEQRREERADADELLLDRDSEKTPTISVVMPTLDEEEGVGECIDRVKRAVEEMQVTAEIVLSDSSTDRTPEIGREKGAIVYEPDGVGYGYAYRYAFERTRGEYVVMGDADTTYDFEQIPRLLGKLRDEDADMVMGSRLDGEIEPGSMPALHKYVGNPLLTAFLNAFYDSGVSDAHSGFRIFTREALETMDLQTTGMEFASEMIMEAGAKDLDIVEVPIVYHEREGDETLDSFQDGWRHVRFMLENAPGYLFSVPGIVLGVLGLGVMALSVSGLTIDGRSPGINAMIAGSLLTMVGYQVINLGVFASVATDPISAPTDPVTKRLLGLASLERSATIGVTVSLIGGSYAVWSTVRWWTAGVAIDSVFSLLAFTAIVVGIQTVFSSFFMSALAGE